MSERVEGVARQDQLGRAKEGGEGGGDARVGRLLAALVVIRRGGEEEW